ncbi:MAG: hypothetical protein ACKVP5_09830 [Aestuariivirga sp.]
MSAPVGAASEATGNQIAQSIQAADAVSAKLDSGWEKELAEPRRVNSSVSEPAVRAQIHSQLIDHKVVSAARGWDSEYATGNNAERHPDNRFAEGVSASGEEIYSPADHVARAFTPSPEDERLALLIAQQARAVAPEAFGEKTGKGADSGKNFDFLPLISRGFGIALLVICMALLWSF